METLETEPLFIAGLVQCLTLLKIKITTFHFETIYQDNTEDGNLQKIF